MNHVSRILKSCDLWRSCELWSRQLSWGADQDQGQDVLRSELVPRPSDERPGRGDPSWERFCRRPLPCPGIVNSRRGLRAVGRPWPRSHPLSDPAKRRRCAILIVRGEKSKSHGRLFAVLKPLSVYKNSSGPRWLKCLRLNKTSANRNELVFEIVYKCWVYFFRLCISNGLKAKCSLANHVTD